MAYSTSPSTLQCRSLLRDGEHTAQHWGAKDPPVVSAVSSIDQNVSRAVVPTISLAPSCNHDAACSNGCASGALSELRQRGFTNLRGIDPSPAAVASAQEQQLDVEVGTGVPASSGDHDLVIANHVMEHLVEARTFVSDLYNVVAPGGHCYIEVLTQIALRRSSANSFVDFNLEHINHYSRRHLEMSLGQAGFSLRDNGDREILHDWPYPTFGLWQKALLG